MGLNLIIVCSFLFATVICGPMTDFNKYFYPENLEICREDERINDCIKHDLEIILPKISKGIKEIGLPPMDPNIINEIKFEYPQTELGEGKASFRNVHTYGLSGAKIFDVRSEITPERVHIEVDFLVPKILIEGSYKGDGRILQKPISAKGHFNVSMIGVNGTWYLDGEKELINGVKHLRIQHLTMRPDVEKMQVYFSEIFPGNDELNQLAMQIVNQNWKLIYHEMLPLAEEFWDSLMTEYANKLFLNVPYEEIIQTPL